jgi:hypothetical protein
MHTARPWRRSVLTLALVAAALACTAQAASAARPAVVTGGAAVSPSTATFTGTVDPQGLRTTYWFEYGTTSALGARSSSANAGAGGSAVTAAASVGNLTADTVYHYRLVARNRDGTTRGARRTVRTQRAPLGLSLSAAPNPVPFGTAVTLGGILTGSGNAGRQVQIFQNPFPYTAGFTPVGSPVVTNAQGGFALAIAPPALTTQFRARLTGDPDVASPILTLPVAVRVSTGVDIGRRRSDGVRLVRFAGRIRPARDGAQFAVQRLSRDGTRWVTVAGGITRSDSAEASRYARRVRVRHSGTYRVYVRIVDGNLTSATGREIAIRLRRAR